MIKTEMKNDLLNRELQEIKKDINAYNFIKSILRLFAVRLQQTVPVIGTCRLVAPCGIGGNGVVYEVTGQEDQAHYALKIPFLSHSMIEWFDLSREHMFDDPYPKIDAVAAYFASTDYRAVVYPHRERDSFRSVSEERSYYREFDALRAMTGERRTISLLDYGTFDLCSFRADGSGARKREEIRGCSYYVLPLVQGIPLPEVIEKTMPDRGRWKMAFRLFGEILEIVDAVHQRGVIHRDLHPGNFLWDPEMEILNLIDFGSAMLIHPEHITDIPGEKRGTIRFMSPEQFLDPCSVDVRADYYYLGGLLFYMLTQKEPYARDRSQIRRRRPVEQILPEPDFLTEVAYRKCLNFLNRLLQERKEDRFQSMEEIREEWMVCERAIRQLV